VYVLLQLNSIKDTNVVFVIYSQRCVEEYL